MVPGVRAQRVRNGRAPGSSTPPCTGVSPHSGKPLAKRSEARDRKTPPILPVSWKEGEREASGPERSQGACLPPSRSAAWRGSVVGTWPPGVPPQGLFPGAWGAGSRERDSPAAPPRRELPPQGLLPDSEGALFSASSTSKEPGARPAPATACGHGPLSSCSQMAPGRPGHPRESFPPARTLSSEHSGVSAPAPPGPE